MGKLLENKNILIMGIRNKWSIAWGIAKAASEEGSNLIFTYQGEREREDVNRIISEFKNSSSFQCDISSDAEIDALFDQIKKKYNILNGVVHSIAHAKKEEMQNPFVETSREGFSHAMDVSVYSLISVSRRAKELMNSSGSIITLTYLGAERVFPGYNVMGVAKAALEASVRYLAYDLGPLGIRVNAISAGPIKTVSAKGVKDFNGILDVVEKKAPLKRGVELEDLGGSAVYLLSNLSNGVTGEVMHVDCGYSTMGI